MHNIRTYLQMMREKTNLLLKKVIHDPLMTQQVFMENEVKANLLISRSMLAAAGMLLILWFLNSVGVLAVSRIYVLPVFLVGTAALSVPAGISLIYHGEKSWIKYMLLISVTAALAYLDSILTFNAPLLIVMPVVFSCRYYSCSVTVKTTLLTSILFAVSAWCGAVLSFANPDMNFVNADMGIYVRDVMVLSFLPKWMTFLVISAFCVEIARYGRKMVLEQSEISRKAAIVSTELEMAGRIQSQALPKVESLTENRFRRFDLAAEMIPAKEVGGDFYDFFYPDPLHLAMIIADVADKGIAASLYMMMSKTLLDSRLSMTLSPGQVLESVNRQLFANSPKGMFVTVWLGILNLKTGELVTANAGHEYPVICRQNGVFELVKDKHGFVLGGKKNMRFPEHTMTLNEGDTLFIYTDGVPEANDADGQMFGIERMVESLNRKKDRKMAELISGLRTDIESFANGAPQFDDTTMLAFRFLETSGNAGISVEPVLEELYAVQEYVSESVGDERITAMQAKKLAIAVDEVFSNIVKYSMAKQVRVLCEAELERIRITFSDDGIPFDPLELEAPEGAAKRAPGGLGITITRRLMDGVEYRRVDERNILTLTSNIEENLK